jgi:hypothetical protein
MSPLAQARFCAIQVVNALERDPQLVHAEGRHQDKLALPWGHGVVFTRITRKQFDAAGPGEAIEPHYVICQDEMLEAAGVEEFQQRLWHIFPPYLWRRPHVTMNCFSSTTVSPKHSHQASFPKRPSASSINSGQA